MAHKEPMVFTMPADMNIYGYDTTTIDLIISGKRTGTTRGKWIQEPKIGEVLWFYGQGREVQVKIMDSYIITGQQFFDPQWRAEWSKREGWTEAMLRPSMIGKRHVVFRKV